MLILNLQSPRIEAIETITVEIANQHRDLLKNIDDEIENRIKKQNQAIIFGMQEHKAEKADVTTKRNHDIMLLHDLLKDMKITANLDNIVHTCYRLGKPLSKKVRPLIVVFQSKQVLDNALKFARNLKGNNKWLTVSINRSKTKLQIHNEKINNITAVNTANTNNAKL